MIGNGLQQHPSRSRSVPEGLAHVSSGNGGGSGGGCECHLNRRNWRSSSLRHPNRSVQVVEQITTSV